MHTAELIERAMGDHSDDIVTIFNRKIHRPPSQDELIKIKMASTALFHQCRDNESEDVIIFVMNALFEGIGDEAAKKMDAVPVDRELPEFSFNGLPQEVISDLPEGKIIRITASGGHRTIFQHINAEGHITKMEIRGDETL